MTPQIGAIVAAYLPPTAGLPEQRIAEGRVVAITARGTVTIENAAGERWSVTPDWVR